MADQRTTRHWIGTVRLVAWAVVLALLVLFVAENFAPVEVRLIAWEREIRLAWALLIAGALGYVLGWLRPHFRR